jgi:RNA polymerase sigma-70 factor, ECF subfamily
MKNDARRIEELIARVALRDRHAFAELYQITSPKLFGICLRILRDRGDAEEALQEIYVKIWRRAGRFSAGHATPMSWLSTIARNHAIDMVRGRKPRTVDIDKAHELADPQPDPEHMALMSAEGRRIDACMEELDADRADAVRKAYEHYGVPLNTMRTWLRRSLIKLKECLGR